MTAAALEDQLEVLIARHWRGQAIVAAYLYGSRGRGTHRDDSDIDLGLLLAEPETAGDQPLGLAWEALEFAARLEEALGRRVDLVIMNRGSVDLLHRIFRDGRLVLERDRSARIRFETQARSRYFDMQPILRRYRRQLGASP